MHRVILLVLTVALVVMAGTAGAEDIKIDLDMSAGYRMDKMDWNISGFFNASTFVNPLGEYDWDTMDIVYTKAKIRMSYKKFHARGSLGYGRIVDAGLESTEWSASNRQTQSFHGTTDTDGYVFDASMGIGYKIESDKASVIPLVGYSWHLQHLENKNAYVDVCDTTIDPACVGPIPDFNLVVEPRWQGPWIGLDFSLHPSDKLRLTASAEYHFGDYRSKAIWNARWMGYDQRADAEGFVLSAGLSFKVKDTWDIGLESQYTQWKADVGTHGFAYIGFDTLNEANWKSLYFMLNVTHRFYDINQYKGYSKL